MSLLHIQQSQPSYADGFADSPGDSANPGLWEGLAVACVPSLGPTGSTLYDVSGQGNHGTLTNMNPGADWVIGEGSYSLHFDESEQDNHVLIPDFSYGPYFSIFFRFKLEDLAGLLFQYIFSHGTVNTSGSLNIFFLEEGQGGFPGLRTILRDDVEGNNTVALDIAVNYEDGLWHSYHIVVDSAGSEVFMDGKSLATSAQGGAAFTPDTGIYLGAREDLNVSRTFGGNVDSLMIHDRALSANETQQLYLDPLALFRRKRSYVINLLPTAPKQEFTLASPQQITETLGSPQQLAFTLNIV